jgi:hypothetical protein
MWMPWWATNPAVSSKLPRSYRNSQYWASPDGRLRALPSSIANVEKQAILKGLKTNYSDEFRRNFPGSPILTGRVVLPGKSGCSKSIDVNQLIPKTFFDN